MSSRIPTIYSTDVCTANYGFSLGINDVIPGPKLTKQKDSLVEKAYVDCLDLIAQAKKGKLENKPGCDQEQTLEALISSVLSKVREAVGNICMQELSRHNAPLIMATCGSKGSSHPPLRRSPLQKPSRFRYQCVTDGGLRRSANHCWASCTQWIPGSVVAAFPEEVEGATFEGFCA
jgi:RNA polymerase Rpb1, domain 4